MNWLGIDIGGANLKVADGNGWAQSEPFPLWREPQQLASALSSLLAAAPLADRLAVTMTGELCDSFRTKAEGVSHILSAVQQAAAKRDVVIYLVDGRMVGVEEAAGLPQFASASNWHALAQFACRFVEDSSGLLIDVGSTTSDIVPLIDGAPRPTGLNDTERLLTGELVYTGVGRTPVCATTSCLPYRGAQCPVAAELFATAADAYVILGEVPEDPRSMNTADGRPLTKEFACERLGRMICADATTFNQQDAEHAAAAIRDAQQAALASAIRRVIATMRREPKCVLLSGSGEFLARSAAVESVPGIPLASLAAKLGRAASQCAPAHALAVLAAEWHRKQVLA